MINFSIQETIESRKSIRTYENRALFKEDKSKINDFISYLETAPSPFDSKVRICLFEENTGTDSKKLGTYGVIKGANNYLGVVVEDNETAMEATGYVFEKLVLYAQSIGLGTCWLGGTFNKGEFAKHVKCGDNEIFPIASPIGYPASKSHAINKIMRKAIKADSRKPWDELFFDKDFSTPLSKNDLADWAVVLDMVRWSPSAGNKQPCRVVRDGSNFHFYEKKDGMSSVLSHDIQRLDVGIAACHFELAAKDKGFNGKLTKLDTPNIKTPENMVYILSWVAE